MLFKKICFHIAKALTLPCTMSKEVRDMVNRSDYDALKQDWETVGKDIWYGIDKLQSKIDQNEK